MPFITDPTMRPPRLAPPASSAAVAELIDAVEPIPAAKSPSIWVAALAPNSEITLALKFVSAPDTDRAVLAPMDAAVIASLRPAAVSLKLPPPRKLLAAEDRPPLTPFRACAIGCTIALTTRVMGLLSSATSILRSASLPCSPPSSRPVITAPARSSVNLAICLVSSSNRARFLASPTIFSVLSTNDPIALDAAFVLLTIWFRPFTWSSVHSPPSWSLLISLM